MKSLPTFLSENKQKLYVTGSLGAGVFIGWLLFHSDKRVEYREQVKTEYVDRVEYRDRIVERVVKDTSSDRKQNVRVVTRYIERPDGTKETTKEEISETHEQETSKTVADKTQDTVIQKEVIAKTETKIEKVETPVAKEWHLSGNLGLTSNLAPVYGAQVEKRLWGPVFVGMKADTNPSVGVVLGMEF
jgi:hypothetical protein